MKIGLSALVMTLSLPGLPAGAGSLSGCTARDGSAGLELRLGCTSFEAEKVEILGDEFAELPAFPRARSVTVITEGTGPVDLSVLQALPDLETLFASRLVVTDLKPLANIPLLRKLAIGYAQTDPGPIAGLTNLTTLSIGSPGPIDLAPLSGLPKLSELFVSGESDVDATGLGVLPELRHLMLGGSSALWLAELRGLGKLRSLEVHGQEIEDPAPLCDPPALRALYLSRVRIADLSWLGDCTALEELRLTDLGARDISAVAQLRNLRFLSLDGTLPRSLAPLRDLPGLERLSLKDVRADLSPLRDMPSLTRVVFPDGTQVDGQEAILRSDLLR